MAIPSKPTIVETAAVIPAPSMSRAAVVAKAVPPDAGSEDFPDNSHPVANDSADPACRFYFSAYGLAPSQLRWITQDRKKEFPGICPAADPSQVDFVMLLTHDDTNYLNTLPTPIHHYRDGFSDFNATSGVDNADITNADAEKAHRQLVWVFVMKRGSFNPATFSPRRRYQFTKEESSGARGGVKTLEDAFNFASTRSPE